jgi:hypothetical protein
MGLKHRTQIAICALRAAGLQLNFSLNPPLNHKDEISDDQMLLKHPA